MDALSTFVCVEQNSGSRITLCAFNCLTTWSQIDRRLYKSVPLIYSVVGPLGQISGPLQGGANYSLSTPQNLHSAYTTKSRKTKGPRHSPKSLFSRLNLVGLLGVEPSTNGL